MHIEIDAECRRGLRIIEEIPDIKLCKIEGYNGIGKTSAIRLLRLCVGEQPFEGNDAAWRTFRDQLVGARVRITHLREATSIEWELEPNHWPDRQAESLGARVGSIKIDGRSAVLQDVQNLLKVHHLNTTETPVKILTDRTAQAASTVENWFNKQGAARAEELDHLLARVADVVGAVPTAEVRLRREVVVTTRKALDEVLTRTALARARIQLLDRAVAAADRLDRVRGSSPLIEVTLRELTNSLSAADEAVKDLDARIAAGYSQQRHTEAALERRERAKRLVARHDASLRRSRGILIRVAAEAKVDPTIDQIARTARELSTHLNDLIETQPDIGSAPQVLVLLNDLSKRLDGAMASNFADRILIERTETQQEWTVASLREAFQVQIDRLAKLSRGSDADSLTAEITAVRNRIDALAKVEQSFQSLQKFEVWLQSAEAELEEAENDLAGDEPDQVSDLLQERARREREVRELQSRIERARLELEVLSGGGTEEALAAELEALCREAGIEPSRVRGSLEREKTEFDALSQQEAVSRMRYQSETHALEECIDRIEHTIRTLLTDESVAWLRQAVPQITQLETSNLDEQLDAFDSLMREISSARDRLTTTMNGVRGISGALDALAKVLGNMGTDTRRPQLWTAPVGRWLGRQVKQWFDDDIMRKALFSGGHGVELDPSDLTVSWKVDGEEYKRPLSFFSSGEQAFAFTRARVIQLDRDVDQVPNRFIVLDEFGAFLDAERLRSMAEFLTEREENTPHDQVLVILPASIVPPDSLAETSSLTAREAELARRGYFAEVFRA